MGYNIQVSNDKYTTLALSDQIFDIVLIEAVGNILPMFKLSFRDNDFEKLKYLNEVNPITIGYQIDDRLISNQFVIKQTYPDILGSSYNVSIAGYLNKFEYFKGVPKLPFIQDTSINAMKQLASQYFIEVQSSNIVTEDSMNWIHNGKNARNFIQEMWKHAYSPDSLPIIGIGLDGIFRITDIATLASQEPKYYFSNILQEGYQTYVDAHTQNSSLVNTSIFGYTSNRNIITEDTLQIVESEVSPQVTTNTSNRMNEQVDIPTRQLAPMFQSSNVHEHWYEALHQNTVRWSSLNNNTIIITTYNSLIPLNILDLIYAEIPENNSTGQGTNGNYIISRKEIVFDSTGNVTCVYTGIREVSQNVAMVENSNESTMTTYKI